jgi:uncharacterized membrane protein (DUF485 family)
MNLPNYLDGVLILKHKELKAQLRKTHGILSIIVYATYVNYILLIKCLLIQQ